MDIKLNDDHDIDLTNNVVSMVTGVEEIRQLLKQRLQLFYGEWFLDQSKGVPYFQTIMQKNVSRDTISAIFKKTITETPGVLNITKFDFSYDNLNRRMTINFGVTTQSGNIDALVVQLS